MSKAFVRAGLAGLACLATVTAATLSPSASLAASPHPTPERAVAHSSKYGYNATVYGTKVVVGGAQIRTLKDALINRGCTRQTGLDKTVSSVLSTAGLPDVVRQVLSLSTSTSTTSTYHDQATGRYGVLGTNVLGDIDLGGVTVAGITLPEVTLQGLKSTADSFVDPAANNGKGRFGHHESFTYQGLGLKIPDNTPISSSLNDLLGLLGIDPNNIPPLVNVPVQTLVQLLVKDLGTGLVIPNLLTIKLGQATGHATANSATSNAYALYVSLDQKALGLSKPVALELGQANSVISQPVQAGVFRSKLAALEANVADVLRVGGVFQRALPCQGTNGKTVTTHVASAGVPGLLDLSGITYSYAGQQVGKKAQGFVQTAIGNVSIPVVGLDIKGLVSRVTMASNHPGQRVTSHQSTRLAQILIDGKAVTIPRQGQTMRYQNKDGADILLRRTVLGNVTQAATFFGTKLTALRITLPGVENGITLDLGVANGEVFFR